MRRADSCRSPELALAQDRTLTMNKPEQSQDAEPSLQESPAPALASRLRVRGRSFIGSGIVLVVAFVLTVANAGYGTNPDPNRAFGERASRGASAHGRRVLVQASAGGSRRSARRSWRRPSQKSSRAPAR